MSSTSSSASTALLWCACVIAAAFPPAFGVVVSLLLSPSGSLLLPLLCAVSWSLQLLGWGWSAAHHSEKFYDLIGSLTHISLVTISLLYNALSTHVYPTLLTSLLPFLFPSSSSSSALSLRGVVGALNARQLINSLLLLVWASRLGSHLFARINKDGKDGRFDMMRDSGAKLLLPWMTQGLWVFLLSLPVTLSNALLAHERSHVALTSSAHSYNPSALHALTWRDVVGWSLWLAAFAGEVVADEQKKRFAAQPSNKHRFIDEGLWHYSRHPNYLAEITMHFALFLSASSSFTSAWHDLSVIGPCFNAFLILAVSGLPLLEARSNEKFGKDPAYQAYKRRTPLLLPRFSS